MHARMLIAISHIHTHIQHSILNRNLDLEWTPVHLFVLSCSKSDPLLKHRIHLEVTNFVIAPHTLVHGLILTAVMIWRQIRTKHTILLTTLIFSFKY